VLVSSAISLGVVSAKPCVVKRERKNTALLQLFPLQPSRQEAGIKGFGLDNPAKSRGLWWPAVGVSRKTI